MMDTVSGEFKFDLKAKRTRLSDADLILALQIAAETFGEKYFTTTQYDRLEGKQPHSETVVNRFGSWKKALALVGIIGGRERRYPPEYLVANLEVAWKQLGYPPGKRQIATLGEKISETPYKRHWGSVLAACEAISAFHEGKISKDKLLAGNTNEVARKTIPLKDRWAVLKRDNYSCKGCGRTPSNDHTVELEVDHIKPIAKGGENNLENLQTLCRDCNQGKKDK